MDQDTTTRPDEGRDAVTAAVREALDAMQERIDQLAERLMAMTDEVRTRRLVVVDEDGFERIVASTLEMAGRVEVRCKQPGVPEGTETYVAIQADEESIGYRAAVFLGAKDQTVGELQVCDLGPHRAATTSLELSDYGDGPDPAGPAVLEGTAHLAADGLRTAR